MRLWWRIGVGLLLLVSFGGTRLTWHILDGNTMMPATSIAGNPPAMTTLTTAATPRTVSTSPFLPTEPNPMPAPGVTPEGMVWIPGETFSQGAVAPNTGFCMVATRHAVNDAKPIHRVRVNGFWMDAHVWQWCSDCYRPDSYATEQRSTDFLVNPSGPAESYDPDEPGLLKRVQRGESFLCSDQSCTRYMVGAAAKVRYRPAVTTWGFAAFKTRITKEKFHKESLYIAVS